MLLFYSRSNGQLWFKISFIFCVSIIVYHLFHVLSHYPIIIPSLSHHYPIISHIFSRKIPKFWHLQGTAVKSSMAHWSQTGRAACNWHLAIQDIRCYMTWMRYITCIIHVYYIHIIYIIYVCVCAYAYASICIHIEYVYIYICICICICTCMYM
jgi:hypothetical protein